MIYGREFQWRQSPYPEHRLGRFTTGESPILIGAPVVVPDSSELDATGRHVVELATGAQAPKPGLSGICYWEGAYEADRGVDPVLTRMGDISFAPADTPIQVCHGTEVRALLKNTEASRSVGNGLRTYTGRNMVNPTILGATPGLAAGDYLTPGAGNDDDGFWHVTTDRSLAWFFVWSVDLDLDEVTVQMAF